LSSCHCPPAMHNQKATGSGTMTRWHQQLEQRTSTRWQQQLRTNIKHISANG
jgi:hypothetical protein